MAIAQISSNQTAHSGFDVGRIARAHGQFGDIRPGSVGRQKPAQFRKDNHANSESAENKQTFVSEDLERRSQFQNKLAELARTCARAVVFILSAIAQFRAAG